MTHDEWPSATTNHERHKGSEAALGRSHVYQRAKHAKGISLAPGIVPKEPSRCAWRPAAHRHQTTQSRLWEAFGGVYPDFDGIDAADERRAGRGSPRLVWLYTASRATGIDRLRPERDSMLNFIPFTRLFIRI